MQINILSYNIRGFGRGIKWASIRNLVGRLKVDLLCLQETKRESFDKASCQALWGHPDLAWEWQPAVNAVVGLLCVWNNKNFQVDLRLSEKGFIMLGGVWLADMQRVVVVNIYVPCDIVGKRQLWQDLSIRKMQSQDNCLCFVGDFNCIRHPSERMGSNRGNSDTNIISEFND